MRRDANGLIMISAALLVICAVIFLVAHHELGLRREQIRAQGIGLASALSRVPLDRLVPSQGQLGPLPLIRATQSQALFAYAVVVDRGGRSLSGVSAAEIVPPVSPPAVDPSAWASERTLEVGAPPELVREFGAPVLQDGTLVAQVRLGYFEPDYGIVLKAASFHARVALVVFLLIPLAYFWLRRELRPLGEVARELEPAESDADTGWSQGRAPFEAVESIVSRFRSFSEEMDRKTELMQRERMALLASTKVLAHQKNRIEVVFEALPDAVLAIDETGKITVANVRAESMLRKSRDELIGSMTASWSPAPEVSRLVGRYVGEKGRLMRSESIEYSADELGQRRFLASVHPFQAGSGAAVVLRDISLEYSARKTQAEFLAHMAHELKAPLNVMSLYAEGLLGPDAEDESFRVDACNVIRDEIDRLNGLINNIFSIGRIESGIVSLDRQRVRTRELLSDVFEATSREGGDDSLEFVCELPESLAPIYADKQLISIAIKNLLTNAIKYNREGGRVRLVAEEGDDGLLIRVLDTGFGIPEEELELVFEKFYRSEDESIRKISGHGLGLALVKEIVALHGGEIRVQSELGSGSEFALFFSRNAAIFREEA